MATATNQTRFTEGVRAKLAANKIAGQKPDSIRSLAKVMGRGSEARAATYRRSLFKWLAEGEPNPTRESRAMVADALGLEASELADDDEESDPVAVLMNALRAVVRDELSRAVKLPSRLFEESGSAVPTLVVWAVAFLILATGWTAA